MAIDTDTPPAPPPTPPTGTGGHAKEQGKAQSKKRWSKPAIHIVDDSVLHTGSGPQASQPPPIENSNYHIVTS